MTGRMPLTPGSSWIQTRLTRHLVWRLVGIIIPISVWLSITGCDSAIITYTNTKYLCHMTLRSSLGRPDLHLSSEMTLTDTVIDPANFITCSDENPLCRPECPRTREDVLLLWRRSATHVVYNTPEYFPPDQWCEVVEETRLEGRPIPDDSEGFCPSLFLDDPPIPQCLPLTAEIIVEPNPVEFPDTMVGMTSSVVVQITRIGEARISLDPLSINPSATEAAADFRITQLWDGCSPSGPPGPPVPGTVPGRELESACTFTVEFKPSAPGERRGVLTIPYYVVTGISPLVPMTERRSLSVDLTGYGIGGRLRVEPASICFPDSPAPGLCMDRTATGLVGICFIHNDGPGDLTIDNIRITGEWFDFVMDPPTQPFTMSAGESVPITVKFCVPAAGTPIPMETEGMLVIESDDLDMPTAIVELQYPCTMPPPPLGPANISVFPRSITFPDTDVGVTSLPQMIYITNIGGSPLRLMSVAEDPTSPHGADFSDPMGCTTPLDLAPGMGCTVNVRFTPMGAGPRSARVLIGSSDADESLVAVDLTGNGSAPPPPDVPNIVVIPRTFTFPDTPVGETSTPMSFIISNTGGSPLQVDGISRLPADFLYNFMDCIPGDLAPGDACTFNAAFKPTRAGSFMDDIFIMSNDPDEPSARLTLIGTATSPPGGPPNIVVSPRPVVFPDTPVGMDSEAIFTISNTGGGPLDLISVTSDTTIFSIMPETCTPSIMIAPGGFCTYRVTFSPPGPGTFTGRATITSNDPDERTLMFDLIGTGLGGQIMVDPFPCFPNPPLLRRCSDPQTVTIRNAGPGDLRIDAIITVNPMVFEITGMSRTLPAVLHSEETMTVMIQYCRDRETTTDLIITSNDPVNATLHVPLMRCP